MLHTKTVEAGALALIKQFMRDPQMEDCYLVGGAALSLLMGHRTPVSIDLFSHSAFDPEGLSYHLERIYNATCIHVFRTGLCCVIGGIKVDILTHDYQRMDRSLEEDGIRLESIQDLGAIKLNAVVGNGSRLKDFVDIYFLLEHESLDFFLNTYVKKYLFNRMMATAALRYYKDIKPATIRFVRKSVTLADVVKRFEEAVRQPRRVFNQEGNEGKKGLGSRDF